MVENGSTCFNVLPDKGMMDEWMDLLIERLID